MKAVEKRKIGLLLLPLCESSNPIERFQIEQKTNDFWTKKVFLKFNFFFSIFLIETILVSVIVHHILEASRKRHHGGVWTYLKTNK